MKHLFVLFSLTLALALSSTAQEKKGDAPQQPTQAQMDEMMKKWKDAATPGNPHKMLAELAGTWEAEVKTWMGGPSSQPTVTKGTSEMKTLLGGRFLEQTVKAEMMGMPFEGTGVTGYDNVKQKYVGTWMDNFGTCILTMSGTADQTGTVITMWGTMDEPTTGERDKLVKYVTRILGKDKHVFEIHDLSLPEGQTKTMEMLYTRKKG